MKRREASIATRRFGLGPRPGDVSRIASDPRGYVLAALQNRTSAELRDAELVAGHVSLTELRQAQLAQRDERNLVKAAQGQAQQQVQGQTQLPPAASTPGKSEPAKQLPMQGDGVAKPGEIRREVFREEVRARIGRAVSTDEPIIERLVMFWSNHFSISAQKGPAVRVLAGAFEREAIRPHVLGRFADMLKAVVQHPAMLIYLDNAQSIGPQSPAGRNRGRGLNENLAREILELHTLGVSGGYTQADVTNFAKVLTGWTVAEPRMPALGNPKMIARMPDLVPGKFIFTPNRHEPGPQTVLGRRYEDQGQTTGEAVLGDLARHASTARHLAGKLARHFLADNPPPELVKALVEAFRRTDGDLAAVARVLVAFPACWEMPARKVVPPYDFLVSLVRGLGLEARPPEMIRLAGAIGQPIWSPPSPKGWPDDDDAWMGPSAVRERLRIAERTARLVDRSADPRQVAEDLFGDSLSQTAKLAIERAEAREQGFELLVMAPEFLRR